jgi:hypothetical protein
MEIGSFVHPGGSFQVRHYYFCPPPTNIDVLLQKKSRDPAEHQLEVPVSPPPPVMNVSTLQPPRRTRPSVPKSSNPISNYPYKVDGPVPSEEDGLKAKCCPVVSTSGEQSKHKSRRRRKAEWERPRQTNKTPKFQRQLKSRVSGCFRQSRPENAGLLAGPFVLT